MLTSFSLVSGKCSHGGLLDTTSYRDPTGGINKDDISSSHGFLHQRAADMAINATIELLEDIRVATDNVTFLRYETIDLWYFSSIKGRNRLCYNSYNSTKVVHIYAL